MHRYLPLFVFVAVPFTSLAADANAARAASDDIQQRGPLRLTLKRAVELALSPEGNTYIQLADENLKQAKMRSIEARSALLPDIEGQAGRLTRMQSLSALGLDLATDTALTGALGSCTTSICQSIEKPVLDGIIAHVPRVVGPYSSVDVRATAAQSLFNLANITRYQASRVGVRASKQDRSNTDQQVSSTVAKAYLAALRTNADVEAGEADVALAQALLKQSENQKEAGTGTGLDVTRAKVQLADEQQRLLVDRNARTKSYLQLLRVIGLNLATEVELTDKLKFDQVEPVTLEQAEAAAFKKRADYKAQADREDVARLNANSVKYERIPNVVAYADYGTTGADGNIVSLLPTHDYGFEVRVPIFDGGRRDARRVEATSQFRQERTRTNDLREQVELDLRNSLDSLHSAEQQVQVAEDGLTLADSDLTQTRRRFAAGFASSLEVTDAQTKLARARDNRIAALFNYNVARIDLGAAMGNVEQMIQ
jgi:outer membrane protein